MRAVIQRVTTASVRVADEIVGRIDRGLLILLGAGHGDDAQAAQSLADKIMDLRIFSDENGKMNASIRDIRGGCLVVSQFTLYADCRKGRRPSFVGALAPEPAKDLCDRFAEYLRRGGLQVETGVFGADMQVSLNNDGPVTIILDTEELARPRR